MIKFNETIMKKKNRNLSSIVASICHGVESYDYFILLRHLAWTCIMLINDFSLPCLIQFTETAFFLDTHDFSCFSRTLT